jgi:hypothetical protein
MAVGLLATACSDSHGQSPSQCGAACTENHDAGGSAVQGGNATGFDNPSVHDAGVRDAGVGNSAVKDGGVASGPERDAGLCGNLLRQVFQAVRNAAIDAALGCTSKSDCRSISTDLMCARGCGNDALVTTRGIGAFQTVVAEQNAGACARFADAGCVEEVPPCPPPLLTEYGCVAGECNWLDNPMLNPGDSCVARELSWTRDGGFVAFHDRQTLTCRHFSLVRETQKGPPAEAHCENDVAADAQVNVPELNGALASDDFNAALAKAPVLFGRDSRPVDGSVFRVEIGGATIDIGDECSAEPGCTPIPAGVAAVRQVLEALAMQQRALGSCARLP